MCSSWLTARARVSDERIPGDNDGRIPGVSDGRIPGVRRQNPFVLPTSEAISMLVLLENKTVGFDKNATEGRCQENK